MSASVLLACKACIALLGSVVQMVNQAESTKETSHLLQERFGTVCLIDIIPSDKKENVKSQNYSCQKITVFLIDKFWCRVG